MRNTIPKTLSRISSHDRRCRRHYVSIRPYNKVNITPKRHSRLLLAGIQKKGLDARLRWHDSGIRGYRTLIGVEPYVEVSAIISVFPCRDVPSASFGRHCVFPETCGKDHHLFLTLLQRNAVFPKRYLLGSTPFRLPVAFP